MNTWLRRLELAQDGWTTHLQFSETGVTSGMHAFGCWAKTWHWHGRVAEVCLHDHAIGVLDDPEFLERSARAVSRVHEACFRAKSEYPQSVPHIGERLDDGRLGLYESKHATDQLRPPEDRFRPTESLPEDMSGYAELEGDLHLSSLKDAALSGLHVEDRLNHYFGRARYASDCQSREWGYLTRICPRKVGDLRVKFAPQEASTRILHESVVSAHVRSTAKSMLDLFATFAPGGARHDPETNGLPSGFSTLDEYRAEQEARKAALHNDEPDL